MYNLEQFLLRRGRLDGETVKQLDHETSESLECTWYTDRGADFDEDALCGMNVDLELSSLVDWGIEQSE